MGFASGKFAIGLCDICGFEYKLNSLKSIINNGTKTSLLACRSCWTPDHPQNFVNRVRVTDYTSLRTSRPDNHPDITNIKWSWNPVHAFEAQSQLGEVTVTVAT